jgi:hypothetical protein
MPSTDEVDMDVRPRGYADIKALVQQLGRPTPSLLALHRSNDPFYAGSPADMVHATWFAELWRACGYEGQTGIHLRRMHYLVVSKFPDLQTADTATDGLHATQALCQHGNLLEISPKCEFPGTGARAGRPARL